MSKFHFFKMLKTNSTALIINRTTLQDSFFILRVKCEKIFDLVNGGTYPEMNHIPQ